MRRILCDIHKLIGNSKINAILLPGFERKEYNRILINEGLLNGLVKFHPHDSCLILQPKELPQERYVSMYKSFKFFSLALNNINEWPAILLWDSKDAVFIPLRKYKGLIEDDLYRIFDILHTDKQPFNTLRMLNDKEIMFSINNAKDK